MRPHSRPERTVRRIAGHIGQLRAQGFNSKYIHYHSAIVSEKLNSFNVRSTICARIWKWNRITRGAELSGLLYAENNRKLDEAETLLKRALAIEPENPFYLDSLGWVYYRQGRGEEALSLIQQAIHQMESDDAELRDHLGDIYLLLGDTERALAEWRHAFRLDPSMESSQEKIKTHQPETE